MLPMNFFAIRIYLYWHNISDLKHLLIYMVMLFLDIKMGYQHSPFFKYLY